MPGIIAFAAGPFGRRGEGADGGVITHGTSRSFSFELGTAGDRATPGLVVAMLGAICVEASGKTRFESTSCSTAQTYTMTRPPSGLTALRRVWGL